MRTALFCIFTTVGGALFAAPANPESAFKAIAALPIEDMQRVAKVAGCEGTPTPERWHFLVHAPEAENGYREYVVANHQVVARREHSQFAEFLRPDEVLGVDTVKVDSDRLAAVAQQYAKANRVSIATCNYELAREGPGLAPRWKIDCLDKSGRTIGSIIVNATEDKVVAHDGFKKQPQERDVRSSRSNSVQNRRATSPPVARVARQPRPPEAATAPVSEPFLEPVADAPARRGQPLQARRAEPVQVQAPPQGPLTRVVRSIFGDDED